jgi:hypothetical protein
MIFRNYDPGLVVMVFHNITVQGYAADTFINAERMEDGFEMVVGANGDVTRVRNRNRTGSVTATLLQASPTNDLLSAVADEDELFGTGVGPLLVKDLNGTSLAQATEAWIRKVPAMPFAASAESREWIFDCAQLRLLVGGALV